MNDEQSDAESKLAAPRLFGRKKAAGTPSAAEPEPETRIETGIEPVVAPLAEPEPEVVPPVAEPEVTEPTVVQPVAPQPAEEQKAPRPPRARPTLPGLTGLQIAAIAGILVGLFLALATYGSLQACASVRGAATCGGKAGFPLLLAIGIIAVVGGGALLRIFGVRSPMGDSFLAVGLVAVVTVLFFANHYDAWWMLVVVPVLSLAAFVLAHWVSVKYIDPVGEDADRVE